ncbi:MAG: carbohydrate kinase, partial [Thermomicrobiaceae bacterium]|nr:carbohydrate kinase [Thermomicrobiaceae bacterium]
VTPQGWMRTWSSTRLGSVSLDLLRLPREVLSRIDAMVLNSEEQTRARDEIEAVARAGLVAITQGASGARIIDRGRTIEVPAYPVPVIDDVGAGDVFAAALFLLRAEREPTPSAARMAAAAAALRVRGSGPDAVPTRAAVEEFLQRVAEGRAGGGD